MSETQTKQKRALFLLRAGIAFVLLFALIGGLYVWGYRSWSSVAEWADEMGGHAALVYEGDTYALVGKMGKGNLTSKTTPRIRYWARWWTTDPPWPPRPKLFPRIPRRGRP